MKNIIRLKEYSKQKMNKSSILLYRTYSAIILIAWISELVYTFLTINDIENAAKEVKEATEAVKKIND